MFLQIIAVSETSFRYANFQLNRAKLGGPILDFSLHLRNSRKHFHRCASFGALDYDIKKKAIFVQFRRFFIVGTNNVVSGQKLPFSGYKLPF